MLQYILVMITWVFVLILRIRGGVSLDTFLLATMILVTNGNVWAASGFTLMGDRK
jgi:hypothetical protein